MTATVSVIAPKGGQGATTVAATLALLAAADGSQRVLFVSDDAAILGDPRGRTEPWDVGDDHCQLVAATSRPPRWNGDVQIIDGPATGADSTLLVVRNCYLAVRKAAAAAWEEQQADHIVVIREPGRAITPRDIAAALALPAGAITTIDADPAVARSVDAGLLAQSSLPRSLEPLRALSPGADQPPLGTRTPGIDPPVRAALARVDAPTPRPPETGGLQR